MHIIPIAKPLSAMVRVPGSKSLTNRALMIAALAQGTTRITNALFSDDSRYFADALRTLGFEVIANPETAEMVVNGQGGRIPALRAKLFVGNAGTAARFLSAFLTLGEGEYVLDGDERMRQRPISDLVAALKRLGARMEIDANGCPPVQISASGLPGGRTEVAGDISSQFLSALLMAAPYANNDVEIRVSTELNSKPYVDMTIAIMKEFGVGVERSGYNLFRPQRAKYLALPAYEIEPDASAASYFMAAAAVCGGSVHIEGISRRSKQGDIGFVDILENMGCSVREDSGGIRVEASGKIHGVDVDMRDISDTAQTLAVVAPFAATPTRIRGIASSRVKETDRVAAVCIELARMGVQVIEHEDGMTIYPCDKIQPTTVKTYRDHRMAMAFALIGLRTPGIQIDDPGCVSKTFPGYFEVLGAIRPER